MTTLDADIKEQGTGPVAQSIACEIRQAWNPRRSFPLEVGRYEYRNAFTLERFPVQWDGRDYRYAEGDEAGQVVAGLYSDQWRHFKEQA